MFPEDFEEADSILSILRDGEPILWRYYYGNSNQKRVSY